jgi:CRP-like cAMP-binding protein
VPPARAGDTIGEIAALEWGAGFGYARTASVTAATELRALVFAAGDVGELIRRIPILGERLRAIARERLHHA